MEHPRIRILPDELASQIAAGEVVERPASVVKELVENALDAGGTNVRVEIESGGRTRIRVTDDGCGMSREEAALAVRRHATSKIAIAEDLVRIATFGFRGEALPSIASVARLDLVTRRAEDTEGTRVRVEGGATAEVEPAGTAPGTRVDVRDLFFATPARLKFLKTERTEAAHAVEAVVRIALGAPGVGFRVMRDGRVAKDFLRHEDLGSRVREVFPDADLFGAEGGSDDVKVVGWVSAPQDARSGAGGFYTLVNGRYVRDRRLLRAVAQAYGGMLEPGRYPAGALFVTVPHESVDVNVHPQKLEVRFANPDRVVSIVTSVLAEVVKASPWARPSLPADPAAAARAHIAEQVAAYAQTGWLFQPAEPASARGAAPAEATLPDEAPAAREAAYASLVPIGQARLTYLVCEGPDGIYVLDQHAVHERVTFDRLRRAYRASDVGVQPYLFPERVDLGPELAAVATEHAGALARMGLEVEPLGEDSVALRSVPALVARADPKRLLRDVLGELSGSGESSFTAAVEHVLATMACHGSIRAGDRVTQEEARALLAALDTVDFSGNCPHGRPILHALRWSELERRVGRR